MRCRPAPKWPRSRSPARASSTSTSPKARGASASARCSRKARPTVATPRGKGHRAGVEFVSANPTGPLHVGHGRAAVIGDCIARVLDANGWDVTREFYYNDAGAQIDNLAISVQARAQGKGPDDAGWPEDGYRGDYIKDVAQAYLDGDSVEVDGHVVTGEKNPDDLDAIRRFAVAYLRREQNLDLAAFGVSFDVYFLESSLYTDGKVEETVRELVTHGHTYEEGGALWLRSTDFGDDKDRVMRKSDGTYTYFLPDVAYHLSKWQRGYERAITELGADHHGSLARVRAGLQALDCGIPQGWPEYVLHQMVTVMRGGEEVKLSKRAGSYVTLRDLIDEAGRDATRWFLIARKPDSQLTFDIDLARSQSLDNPVYYVQVSHARMCGLVRQLKERGLGYDPANGLAQPLDLDDAPARELVVDPVALPRRGRDRRPRPRTAPDRRLPARAGTDLPDVLQRPPVPGRRCQHPRCTPGAGDGDATGAGERSRTTGRQRPRGDVSGSTTRQDAGKAQPGKWRRLAGMGMDGAGHPACGRGDPGRAEVPQVRRRRLLPSAAEPGCATGRGRQQRR